MQLDKKQLGPHVKLRGLSYNRNFQNWGKLLDRTKLPADDGFEYLSEQMLFVSKCQSCTRVKALTS